MKGQSSWLAPSVERDPPPFSSLIFPLGQSFVGCPRQAPIPTAACARLVALVLCLP